MRTTQWPPAIRGIYDDVTKPAATQGNPHNKEDSHEDKQLGRLDPNPETEIQAITNSDDRAHEWVFNLDLKSRSGNAPRSVALLPLSLVYSHV